MRKARLRKLDAQKGSLSVETSPSILQSTSTKSDAVAVIPDQKSVKRRFKDSSHCHSDNSNSITEEAKVNKNMVRDSLLSTALDRKKDDQSQHTSTKAIPTVQALSSESSSITASTDTLSTSATTLDQKRVDENGIMAKRIGINDFAKTKGTDQTWGFQIRLLILCSFGWFHVSEIENLLHKHHLNVHSMSHMINRVNMSTMKWCTVLLKDKWTIKPQTRWQCLENDESTRFKIKRMHLQTSRRSSTMLAFWLILTYSCMIWSMRTDV